MDSDRPSRTSCRRRRALGSLLSLLLGLLAAGAPARAGAEPPMWVVRDADSTIYLFGTAHLLDPSIPWKTDRVQKALDEATQLWVEVALPPGGELALSMAMLRRALSDKPLSSLLTEAEQARLRQLLSRLPDGAAMGMIIESTRPWFATITLGTAPLLAAGYESASGADMVLMRVAREQGDEVLGLETAEQQIEWLASAPEDEQLAALKKLLAVPEEEFDASIREMDEAVRAWMKGDAKPLEKQALEWRRGDDVALSAATSYELMIVRRNENWAEQIEKLLAGSGVAFIAVGAGHLVGPDSLQEKLKARGIRAEPY
jgi:uncharacterized protein YbaP (TraB family)